MRLSPDELQSITGRQLPAAQARWFVRHYGQTIPHDSKGPIITAQAWEALVARKCGTVAKGEAQNHIGGDIDGRPTVRLTKGAEQ